MGYTLKAFLGKEDSLFPILEKYSKSQKVNLNGKIYMIPMTDELFDQINKFKQSTVILRFEFLTENVEQKIIESIGNRELAYVESEFFGGQGGHMGIIWRKGKRDILTKFDKESMNKILKELGVSRSLIKDEFEIIGLVKNRHTKDWIE